MPQNIQGDIRTGFDSGAMFDMKLDTFRTMNSVMNRPNNPYYPEPTQTGVSGSGPTIDIPEGMTYLDAMQSNDPKIKNLGLRHMEQETRSNPYVQLGLGDEIRTPYEKASKYIDKGFGFDANIPDIEDYYYRNDYMQHGWAARNLLINPLTFLGRVAGQAALKFGEGLGYVGSMVGSIGSSNYWADVADNGFSKWLEEKEQSYKDSNLLAVYKQAGFDEKGFFSKLVDWSFWNDEIADSVAFMASAMIPAAGFTKLGKIGAVAGEANAFGTAFSDATALGRAASKIGMGSGAEITTWTFNTASESAFEASQVFSDATKKMKELRGKGISGYANLSDEDIRERAGRLSSYSMAGNFAILSLSNAWENKLFFRASKGAKARGLGEGAAYVSEGENWGVRSAALENLGTVKSPLSRFGYYGKKAVEGFAAEGLWEENAQLVIQRMNTLNDEGNFQYERGVGSFVKNLFTQTGKAFSGKDKEALESIGLGALIGIGAGVGLSKMAGDRKALITQVQAAVNYGNAVRNDFFKANDIYVKDKDNEIVFDGNLPRVDPVKLEAKQKELENLFGAASLASLPEFNTSKPAQFVTLSALASYVNSMNKIGIRDVSTRFGNLSPKEAAIFGIDMAEVNEMAGRFSQHARKFEELSDDVDDIRYNRVKGLTEKLHTLAAEGSKSKVFGWLSDAHILSTFVEDEQSSLLTSLNRTRSLSNSSISEYGVEELNKKIMQRNSNKALMETPDYERMSDVEKQYHVKRGEELDREIEEYKKDNPLDAKELPNGFYKPLRNDGSEISSSASEVKSIQKMAEYGNIIHKNLHFAELLSDSDNWFKNYTALSSTPAIKAIEESIQKGADAIEKSPFAKYPEQKPGDFAKVTRLVAKMLAGEVNFSPDEQLLLDNYKDLVEELKPVYQTALESNRRQVLQSKLDQLKILRDATSKKVEESKAAIEELGKSVSSTSDLITEMILSLESGDTVNAQKLEKIIYRTQAKIYRMQNAMDKLQEEVDAYDKRITVWEDEIENSSVPALKVELQDLRDQKILLELEIGDIKGILATMSKLISDIIKIARRLIPGFSVKRLEKILEPSLNTYGEANREAYEGSKELEAYTEIKLKQDERDELKSKLKQLEDEYKKISEKEEKYSKIAQEIARSAMREIEAQYLAITREVGKPPIVDQAEQSGTDSFTPFVPTPPSINSTRPEEEGVYDGNDYIRLLNTKFFTSTFTNAKEVAFNQAQIDHFELMDYLTNALTATEAREKKGKGILKIIAVTQHNVDKLGLRSVLSTNLGGDIFEYEKDSIDNSAIVLVHVIEEGNKISYVDKKLNRISELSGTDKKGIVYTVLRANRFKDTENNGTTENDVYSIKYTPEQKAAALAEGHKLRASIIEKSKAFEIKSPTTLYKFNVTKGIPNKFENADKTPVKNPIVGTLINEDHIGPATIVITTETQKGTTTVAGPDGTIQDVVLPVGKAFIKTYGIFNQVHLVDNNKIDDTLATTILTVLSEMTKEYTSLLEEALKGDLKGRRLADIETNEKMKLIIKFNKMKIKHFGVDYIKFLNGVIQFGTLKAGEVPHPNKVYLSGSKIYFGDKEAIDVTESDDFLSSQKAKQFLTNIYHNVSYMPKDNPKAKQPFVEYYLDKDGLKSREWDSYNHYLLLDKLPDGKNRDYIPITTAIKTAAQHKLSVSPFPPLPFKSQSVIMDVPFVEGVQKKAVVKTATTPAPNATAQDLQAQRDAALSMFTTDFSSEWGIQEEAPEATPAEEAKVEQPSTEDSTPEDDITTIETPMDDDFGEEAFRIKVSGFFNKEADLDSVLAYAAKVVPQFPTERMKHVIQTMDGREALGHFTGSMIKIWEDAEEGTLYHEVFEAVANRLLRDYEWRALENEFKRRKGTYVDRETGEVIKYSEATSQQAKEQIAEEFRHYKLTGQLPTDKNTRTFFQMILDFIRKYILQRPTIDSIFASIDKGKMAKRKVRPVSRFQSNYMVRRTLPVADHTYYDFLQGFTSLMFQDIFQTPQSLSKLDELGEIDEVIYERVKEKIDEMYKTRYTKTKALPTNTPNKAQNERNKKRQADFPAAMNDWEKVKADWGSFVVNHKFYLRKFRMKFDEQYNVTPEEDEMKNMNDYTGKPFKTSQKNSAATSIRLLVGTLLQSRVDGITMSANQIFPKIIRDDSTVFLPQLVNYDNMMLKVVDMLSELNREGLVQQRLKEVSGIQLLQDTTSDKQVEVSKTLTEEQASLSLLYMRLFAPQQTINPEAELNLRTKFMNYISKQAPTPWIYMIHDDGEHVIKNSTSRPFYESFFKNMQSALMHNITDFFAITHPDGVKTYTSKIPADEVAPKMSEYIVKEPSEGKTKITQFLKFLGVDKVLTPEVMNDLALNQNDIYNDLSALISDMRRGVKGVKFTGAITRRNVNIFRYTDKLVDMLEDIVPQSEKNMTYTNGEDELVQLYVPPSFVSRVMSEINNSPTLESLTHDENFPHLKKAFSSDSIMLQRIFNKKGKNKGYKLKMGYIEGIKNLSNDKFTKAAKMQNHQRLGMEFIMNLNGKYVSLPADSDTEWIFDFGEFAAFTNNMLTNDKIVNELFVPKLRSEILTALEYNPHNTTEQLSKVDDGYVIGKSLRFFKNILSKETTKKIHTQIGAGNIAAEDIILKNIDYINRDIRTYLARRTEQTLNNLVENRIIHKTMENDNVVYHMTFSPQMTEKFGSEFTESQIRNVVAYAVINGHIGNMEQFKLFFGDVAQYKDWEKRAKSLFSPIEQTYYDDNGYYNEWMNANKNFAKFDEQNVTIPEGDMFHTIFRNHLTARTVEDFTVVDPTLVNKLRAMKIRYANKYDVINGKKDAPETDGQSAGTLQFVRQLMLKSGWRWTEKNEVFFQYDTALARKELSEAGRYDYPNDELREVDKLIVEKHRLSPPKDGISPLKTSMPSIRPDGTIDFIKHSVYPISYQVAKDMEMLDVYVDMLKRGDDLLNFKSTHKVGAPVDNSGKVTSFYKIEANGSINPYERTDLSSPEVGNLQYPLSFRTVGIQVETQSTEKGQTLSTQMTKDILLNLMPNGIPRDFSAKFPEADEQEIYDLWVSLSEEERNESNDYRLVKDTMRALENLKDKSIMTTFMKLGIRFDIAANGDVRYYASDIKKLQTFILDQMLNLDIDENTIEGLQLNNDLTAFKNASETLPSYDVVNNIIWSIADKAINHMKVNGTPYIQVSSAFFNRNPRNVAYKDDDGWHTVDNRADFDRLVAEGKKMVMTSSELKFYDLTEDGKTVTAMEVYVPHIYKSRVNKARANRGLEPLSDEELMAHLNKNPKLLEGVGFRIPTQAKSSMEFFIIKGFLPESFGKSIVVPSDITTKAGSDFDVDKLQTYLNNWVMKNGMPVYEEFDNNTGERGRMGRYTTFINSSSAKDTKMYIRALAKTDRQQIFDNIKEVINEINKNIAKDRNGFFAESFASFKTTIAEIKGMKDEEMAASIDAIYKIGSTLFKGLTKDLKEVFLNLRDDLDSNDIKGPNRAFEFLVLAKNLSASATGKNHTLLNEMIAMYNAELDLYNVSRERRKQAIEAAKQDLKNSNLTAVEYYKNKRLEDIENEGVDIEREGYLFDLSFDMAKEVAAIEGLPSFEKFGQLPIHLQNTRGAVENMYFESIRNILKNGDRFEQLLSPNNMDNISAGKDAVFQARGVEDEEANTSNFLDINYLVRKRQAFAKGKTDIGIFAIGMTNYANSQVAGIGVGDTIADRDDFKQIMEWNDGDISVPFAGVTVLNVNGSPFIPLSGEKDVDGNYVMDNLSGYITGAVDVAKKPDIVDMGMHTELAATYLLLTRMKAIDKNMIALYMFQPSIREFLKELNFFRHQEYSLSPFTSMKELRGAIVNKYSPKKPHYEKIEFKEQDLIDMIRKQEDANKAGKQPAWTQAELHQQYLALVNFLKIKMYADDMSNNYRASNHDTSKIRSVWSIVMKDLGAEKLRRGNTITSSLNGELKNGIDAFREETFIQKTIDLFNTTTTMFKDVNLFMLQRDNPRNVLNQIARNIYNDTFLLTEDDFIAKMKEYEAGLIDTLLNNHTTTSQGYTISSYIDTFFKESSKRNLYKQWKHVLAFGSVKDNLFLSSLKIDADPKLGVYTIGFNRNFTRDDVLSKNLLTAGWRRMFLSPNKDISDFARALAMSSIIQFGVKQKRGTLTPLIPIEVYSQFSETAMNVIDSVDLSTLEEKIVRENSYKAGFLADNKTNAMEFLNGDGELESKWRSNSKKPVKSTDKVFMRKLTEEELAKGKKEYYNKPVFFWKGRVEEESEVNKVPEQYQLVRMIRPEYVMEKIELVGDRLGYINVPRPEVFDMIKRKDFSYSYYQLYKLVGLDGNTPIIWKKKKIKTGEHAGKASLSYLYKPVNTAGYYNFNENAVLDKDEYGNVVGKKSSLDIHYKIDEQLDSVIYRVAQKINLKDSNVGYISSRMSDDADGAIIESGDIDMGLSGVSKAPKPIQTMEMTPENVVKIANGTKTTTIRSTKQYRAIGIETGKTEVRSIGGDLYNITNRGYLTIQEAGGLQDMLKTEGVDTVEALKFQQTKDWIQGIGKLWVYKIEPYTMPDIAPTDKTPITPSCD